MCRIVEAEEAHATVSIQCVYVRFRLPVLDCIQLGAGGYSVFGAVRRFIDDHIGRLHSAQVSETSRHRIENR